MLVAERQRVEPAHLWIPPTAAPLSGSAADAADLAESAGLVLDLEQRLALEVLLAEEDSGRWAGFEGCIIAARQNMKTATFLSVALLKLFLHQDRKTVWTAHEFPTALEAFTDMQALIDGASHLSRRVKKVNNTNGEEGIELHSGAKLIFRARSKGAGRGLSGNTLILDEALFLRPAHVGSLLPILSAVPNSQVLYGSSAGVLQSAILRGIRDRGRAGNDPSLGYVEWCAPTGGCLLEDCTHQLSVEGCALDDEDKWLQANPALGRRITHRAVRAERRALPPTEFARERMGWWEDPPVGEGGAIDLAAWADSAHIAEQRGTDVVFGVDVAEDRTASITVVWRRPDGLVHGMLTVNDDDRPDARLSPQATVDRLISLSQRWGGKVMLGGPSAALEDALAAEFITTELVSSTDFAQASGALVDAVHSRQLRHDDQDELNEAVRSARWRSVGTAGERAFQLKDMPGIGPLAALTRALHGLTSGPTTGGWMVSLP